MDATIEQIESMTAHDVYELLRSAGIKRQSKSWQDYTRAKLLVFRGEFINPDKYNRMIRWITGYLNV